MTLWHGRLEGGPAEALWAFTASLDVDSRMAADDVAGSRAHVRGLARAGLVSEDDAAALLAALDTVADELASGAFVFAATDEDVHTAVERRVTELAGPAGGRLHTGRSRNDQVATDLRLWAKRELAGVGAQVLALQDVLLRRAQEAGGTYLPGYTHLQRAQPVLLAHHLLAHGWALARDVDRLVDTRRRLDVSPLGAGALAGSSLALDPVATAADLGFAAAFDNSLDAVSDRDFVAEALFDLALLGVHLSRIGEEVVLWSSAEFGFLRLDDAWATGSSMLPQKKNPDVAELARGKSGRLIGHLTGLLVTLKGLPLAYNRDLQEDKEPLFDAVEQVNLGLAALAGLCCRPPRSTPAAWRPPPTRPRRPPPPSTWPSGWWRRACRSGTPTTWWPAWCGTPSTGAGRSLPELVAAHPQLGPDAALLLEPGAAVQRRTTAGGAGPGPVAVQLEAFGERLRVDRGRLGR